MEHRQAVPLIAGSRPESPSRPSPAPMPPVLQVPGRPATESPSDPTSIDNGSRPRRTRPEKEEREEFVVSVEAPPSLVEPPGTYQVCVKRLERWFFKGSKDAPKITLHCVVVDGPHTGATLPMRMTCTVPIRRSSKLWETILVATYPETPKRISRISLKRLFVGRVFQAEIRTLVSPHRDKDGKPVRDGEGNTVERSRSSVIDRFLVALTGTPHDYLL